MIAVTRVNQGAERGFDGPANFFKKRLRLPQRGTSCPQMHLQIAVVGEYGSGRIFVSLVNGRNRLVEVRFRHARYAEYPRTNRQRRHHPGEPWHTLAREHRLELMRPSPPDRPHPPSI